MVLAGGLSRRMGREKLSLEVGGEPLVEHVLGVLRERCEEVLLVGDGPRLRDVRRVTDERPGRMGPLAGIEAGLAAARFDHVFIAAGDMPFLDGSLVEYLLGRLESENAAAVVPRFGGKTHALCAAYDRRAVGTLVGDALDGGVRAVHEFLAGTPGVEYVGTELRRFGDPGLLLMNVNSPADLDLARRRAGH